MKRLKIIGLLGMSVPMLLAGCTLNNTSTNNDSSSSSGVTDGTVEVDEVTEVEVEDDTISESFSLINEEGTEITPTDNVYLIESAGIYTAIGKLENGQIKVNASGAVVEIDLAGASISNNNVSPIYVEDADEVEIKVKKDTNNYIYDTRTTDYSNSTTTDGVAAIYAYNGDIKVTGKGSLYVYSYQNSGIHSKDNLKVKNVTLSIEADNNGLKGNDKVTIEENPTIEIYAGNNGITTSSSDIGNSNAQHGYIYINGGSILINSYGDGIDAAYAVEFATSTDTDGVTYTPTVNIYTEVYSGYGSTTSNAVKYMGTRGGFPGGGGTSSTGGNSFGPGGATAGDSSADKADDSAKGIKATESISITAGNIYIQAHDDGIHGNNETDNTRIQLENGSYASGNVSVSGGNIKIYSSDDGIHADGTLSISGGSTEILMSHEGIEGNIININGGTVIVDPSYTTSDSKGVSIITDDAINASSQLNISGGYIDVSVNPNAGDIDCVDSNGSIRITGGVLIARGPYQQNMATIDADGSVSMTGGTLIACGYVGNITRSNVSTYSLSLASSGSHTVIVNGTSYTFKNTYTYSNTTCYSNVSVSGN